MAAIAGLLRTTPDTAENRLREAAIALSKRQAGHKASPFIWMNRDLSIALCHTGQPVVDLTPDGFQPFVSAGQHVVVALNGYVANGAALRRELEEAGVAFRGHGDAELIAEGTANWGINRLLQKMAGAFAFALWDANTQALHLVRDRMGLCPLFVTRSDEGFSFASDSAALSDDLCISSQAVKDYLQFGRVLPPATFYQDVYEIPPGHRLLLTGRQTDLPQSEAYWSPIAALEENVLRQNNKDVGAMDRLRQILVKEALRLDVPYVFFHDGTSDSYVMQPMLEQASNRPLDVCRPVGADAIQLQTACETLAQLPIPIADPQAIGWHLSFEQAKTHAPVVVMPTDIVQNTPFSKESRLKNLFSQMPDFIRPFLMRALPHRHRNWLRTPQDIYLSEHQHWTELKNATPDWHEPRLDLSRHERLSFFILCDHMIGTRLPSLQFLANASGIDLRMPWTDARLLDLGWPRLHTRPSLPLATWLRGPLRVRMQDLLKPALFERLGLTDTQIFFDDWTKFLAGQDKMAPRLWILMTLLAWTKTRA